jgi:hypothetical protein
MYSYYSPKFSMKLKVEVVYRVEIKMKNYTSLITLNIFISSCSPLLDLENNSTPTSNIYIYNIEENRCLLTMLQNICWILGAFNLYIHPQQIRSISCSDTRQINYRDEQRILLRGAMRYGDVLWLENRQESTKLLLMFVYLGKKMGLIYRCRVGWIS